MFEFIMDQKSEKEDLNLKSLYDLIIIGAGPGGTAAALYAKRKNLSVLVITKDLGGKMVDSNTIENYLGIPFTTGDKLSRLFIDHILELDVPILSDVTVDKILKDKDIFSLMLNDDSTLKAKTVIVATGSSPKKLFVEGEEKFLGKGIAYCAICDGPFYKNKDVLVVGGSSPALEVALDLSEIANSVTIIDENKEFSGDNILVDRLSALKNVTFIKNSKIKIFHGNKSLEKVTYTNNLLNEDVTIKVDGAFIHVGAFPNISFVDDLVKINKKREIIVNSSQETSVEGLYAVGDVTDTPYKQILIAASQGATAALEVNNYIKRKGVL